MKRVHLTHYLTFFGILIVIIGIAQMLSVRKVQGVTLTVLSTADSGPSTLRQAIAAANIIGGTDTIEFNIAGAGVKTINLLSALPDITDATIIDGLSQGGAGYTGPPLIELNGASVTGNGLVVAAGGAGSTIKGLVINDFASDGIQLIGGSNTVQGCYIGTDATGTVSDGNGGNGIAITSPLNTIGGTTSVARNIISGNTSDGVEIIGNSATNNLVQGNFIGTDVNGTADLGNSANGVFIDDALANTIGGTVAGARNIISGNNSDGVEIGSTSTGNFVRGNFIGTDVSGTADLGNNGIGVTVLGASDNAIGGTVAGARNVISGNGLGGVRISAITSFGNLVQGNFIGTNVNGTAALSNFPDGLIILDAPDNTIGGTVAAARNVISGNSQDGVKITGAAATGNLVQGNFIGTQVNGTAILGNNRNGVEVTSGAHENTIGGTVAGARNIISGNNSAGVSLDGTSFVAGNLVQGNFIGTDVNGTVDLENNVGIFIQGASNNTIGGTVAGARNVISGNDQTGIHIVDSGNGNLIQGNFIGTDSSGTAALGNGLEGVFIGSAANTIIGGLSGANTIVFNGGDGVYIEFGAGNGILGNSIHSNGGLGIDLGPNGVTPNDPNPAACPADTDTGANERQNFPVITSATTSAGTIVQGTLNSTANTQFSIQFFSNTAADPTGFGEGQSFIGTSTVTTNASCIANFTFTPASPVAIGSFITATAIDPSNNTSEFSQARQVTSPTAVEFVGFTATSYDDGALIEWQTGMEVNNLGFNLYRDEGGRLSLANPHLLAGSALVAGSVTMGAGRSYAWFDEYRADKGASYWLEDIDTNGKSAWHGPFYPTPGFEKERPASTKQAKALAALGVNESTSVPVESLSRLPGSSASSGVLALTGALPAPYSGLAVKLAIKHEGWYRLSQGELIAAGLDKSNAPQLLQLFVDGKQQAIVVNGQDDNSFDPSDSIEFYATGIDSPFSEARTYYLVAGKQTGRRVSQIKSSAPVQRGGSFAYTVERRERTIYFAALRNGDRENFFGSVIASQPVNQPLTLQHVDLNSYLPAVLKVVLQGVTNLDHAVTIEINGSFAGLLRFQAQASGETTIEIPHSMLQEGSNIVRLIPQGGPSDVSLVDSVRLTYQHTFTADDNVICFTASGGQPVTLEGFSDPAIRVFDVTDSNTVKEINGAIEKQEGKQLGSTASVTFTAPGKGQRALLALTDARAMRPDSVGADNPSDLRGSVQDAAFVIVTPHDFVDQAASLMSYRRARGLSAAIVDIEDVYDEFSFGQKTPFALREFLSHANRKWGTRYALFLGDASFDPKTYLGLGDADLVPTRLVDTLFMETASDDWLADFDQNGIADFAIGRIPARTTTEAETMIGKIYSYETSKPSNEALLVSDRNDGFNFEQANAELIPLLPTGTRAIHVRRAQLGDPGTKAAVIDGINRGQQVVSYAGHGSANVWRGNSLTASDARLLRNREQLTTFVIMNCLNGYFTDPATESLSEALMRNANGGAVAAWASSAMTFADGQASLGQEFYRQVFGSKARLGDATIRAKALTQDGDVRRTWILFGDPSMRMR